MNIETLLMPEEGDNNLLLNRESRLRNTTDRRFCYVSMISRRDHGISKVKKLLDQFVSITVLEYLTSTASSKYFLIDFAMSLVEFIARCVPLFSNVSQCYRNLKCFWLDDPLLILHILHDKTYSVMHCFVFLH